MAFRGVYKETRAFPEAGESVRLRCEALGGSEHGYYAHLRGTTTPTARENEDASIAKAIAHAQVVGRCTCGTPPIKTELAKHGLRVSRPRIERIRDHMPTCGDHRERHTGSLASVRVLQ